MPPPELAIVIPTRDRAPYLDVALASLAEQGGEISHETVVVDDASEDETPVLAARHRVKLVRQPLPRGLNAGRNAGIAATSAPLIAFLDDDVRLWAGWLVALRDGARRHPQVEAFGGPIRACLEGRAPGSCGRERPPITSLDLGPRDRPATMVWGANMAVRRAAFERRGGFDESVGGHGDEEDWLLGLTASGGEIVYLAAAGVDHRRVGDDARLRALALANFRRGRSARVTDERREAAPPLRQEVRVLAGCAWHTVRRGCPLGLVMGAQAAGRLVQGVRGA